MQCLNNLFNQLLLIYQSHIEILNKDFSSVSHKIQLKSLYDNKTLKFVRLQIFGSKSQFPAELLNFFNLLN